MIETGNAIYLHIPKTAGTWIRAVLDPVKINWVDHGIITQSSAKPVFAFARDPWDWHVSFYHFLQQGSETFTKIHKKSIAPPEIQALPVNHSFSDFIKYVCSPTTEYKTRVLSIHKVRAAVFGITGDAIKAENQVITSWQNSNQSYYQHIYNLYTAYTSKVADQSNIVNDMIELTKSVGDLTDEVYSNIMNTSPINVTDIRPDRRSFYTDETAELVRKSCASIIANHNYTF